LISGKGGAILNKREKIMDLALRRGFLWPSYEIYGGVRGFYDYGPLGATLKKRLEDKWREFYCVREGFLEISSPTIAPEEVFMASGHLKSFVDPMVECRGCSEVYRADELIKELTGIDPGGLSFMELDELLREKDVRCPRCGDKFSEVWSYNLMFKTSIGPGKGKTGFLRPETAQGMFLLFSRLYGFYRKKLPFGVAQLGRAYRNEISPRQGIIRLREFNQAEVEIFVDPEEKTHPHFKDVAEKELRILPQDGKERKVSLAEAVKRKLVAHELLAYHLLLVKEFLFAVGIPEDKIRFRQHLPTEMAHYAAECWDAEVETESYGWIEVVGIADRTDYDLRSHGEESGADLTAFIQYEEQEQQTEWRFIPNMAVLGPKYKDKAEKIKHALLNLGARERESFLRKGCLEMEVDGEKIKLDKNTLSLKKETVAGKKIIPHVIEPSFGIDRIIFCILETSYKEKKGRRYLSLRGDLAPIQAAVFPLVSKKGLPQKAREVLKALKMKGMTVTYDEDASIGRRYARVDEIGVPYAVTVDFQTLTDDSVTLRERDSTKQRRVAISGLSETLINLLSGEERFERL
jgi:glycyl-tRNA synthetase